MYSDLNAEEVLLATETFQIPWFGQVIVRTSIMTDFMVQHEVLHTGGKEVLTTDHLASLSKTEVEDLLQNCLPF